MQVCFKRTGERRYAVIVSAAGMPTRAADPAPGFDTDIPHDLVHYVVEAELQLANGVYGRAARGAGTFIAMTEQAGRPRERARQQRKQRKREHALREHSPSAGAEIAMSERLAGLCDIAWRRKARQQPDPSRTPPVASADDAKHIARIVARLDALAPLWRSLSIGGQLVFEWPSLEPLQPPVAAGDKGSGTSRNLVISDGAKNRNGGPQ